MYSTIIKSFDGPNRFLSNFYLCKVEVFETIFDSSEHAYQWSKTLIEEEKQNILFNKTGKPSSAAYAKRYADVKSNNITLRDDWSLVKVLIMEEILYAKFSQNDDIKSLLISTDDAYIEEGNTWDDSFWGVCYCGKCNPSDGKNILGKLLMKLRDNFNETNLL